MTRYMTAKPQRILNLKETMSVWYGFQSEVRGWREGVFTWVFKRVVG